MPEKFLNKIEINFPTGGENELHTDVMRKFYGEIRSKVLEHSDSVREVLLCDKENIARTYALTFFLENRANDEIANIDNEIKNGGKIGETFRNHGYEVRKNVLDVFMVDLPEWLIREFKEEDKKFSKARISEFYAKKENHEPIIYGYVLEIYSPDFLRRIGKELKIYPVDTNQINPSTEVFEKLGVSRDDVWNRLPLSSKLDEWNNMGDSFKDGLIETSEKVSELRKEMKNRLYSKE